MFGNCKHSYTSYSNLHYDLYLNKIFVLYINYLHNLGVEKDFSFFFPFNIPCLEFEIGHIH